MNNLILALLVIPLAANFISEWSGVIQKIQYWLFYKIYTAKTEYNPKRIKPFDCPMCFSFWLTVCFVVIPHFSIESILLPFASGAAAVIINKLNTLI